MNRRLVMTLACAILSSLILGGIHPATAAECGTTPSGALEASKGGLTLRQNESVTSLNFKRGASERRLLFVFDVAGCEITSPTGINVAPVSSDLPERTFEDPVVLAKGSLLTVQLPVQPTAFPPDEYKFFVAISGANVVTAVSPADVKRSEHRQLIPWSIWLVAVIIGIAWASYTVWLNTSEAKRGTVRFVIAYFPVAAVAAFGAAWVIFKQAYLDVDVWQLNVGSVAVLFFTAASAAAGGSTTGPLAKAIVSKVRTGASSTILGTGQQPGVDQQEQVGS